MHLKQNPGRGDLSTVKFSASYDLWRPKKHHKTEKRKFEKIVSWASDFRNFCQVFEELEAFWRQNQLPERFLL